MGQTDSLDNAVWNVDVLHGNDFPQLSQTVHIFDLTAELGTVKNRNYNYLLQLKCSNNAQDQMSPFLSMCIVIKGLRRLRC